MESQTFVFFGIVGSGKGTQVKLLMDALKAKDGKEIVYAYPGAEFRKLLEGSSYPAQLIRDSLNRGELQPDFFTDAIVANILAGSLTPEKHLIADGYPRTIAQSKCFEQMMKFYRRQKVTIIYIEVSKEEATRRNLLRGRADDTEEGLKRRFDEYVNNVVPAMNYFKDKAGYEVIAVNGEQSVEAVHEELVNKIK